MKLIPKIFGALAVVFCSLGLSIPALAAPFNPTTGDPWRNVLPILFVIAGVCLVVAIVCMILFRKKK